MGAAFDFAPERPEHIQTILDGLDRYNPETTATFQDYVMAQCESQTYDCYANLALLKLYVAFRQFCLYYWLFLYHFFGCVMSS
jgi:translation initiation factor 3 subunit K